MSIRVWEDCMNNGAGYEEAQHARRAWAEQQRLIEAVRMELREERRQRGPVRTPEIEQLPMALTLIDDMPWDGGRVALLRDRLRMNIPDFGRLIGVSERTVRSWELGERKPRIVPAGLMRQLEQEVSA